MLFNILNQWLKKPWNKIIINKVCRWQGDCRRARSKSTQNTLNRLANCKLNNIHPDETLGSNQEPRGDPPPLPQTTPKLWLYQLVIKSQFTATKPSADSGTWRGVSRKNRNVILPAPLAKVQLLQEYRDSPGGKSSSRKLVNCEGFKEEQEWGKHSKTCLIMNNSQPSVPSAYQRKGDRGPGSQFMVAQVTKNKYNGTLPSERQSCQKTQGWKLKPEKTQLGWRVNLSLKLFTEGIVVHFTPRENSSAANGLHFKRYKVLEMG